jgi:hypothetical protein
MNTQSIENGEQNEKRKKSRNDKASRNKVEVYFREKG